VLYLVCFVQEEEHTGGPVAVPDDEPQGKQAKKHASSYTGGRPLGAVEDLHLSSGHHMVRDVGGVRSAMKAISTTPFLHAKRRKARRSLQCGNCNAVLSQLC
jgi:hypothetical protein